MKGMISMMQERGDNCGASHTVLMGIHDGIGIEKNLSVTKKEEEASGRGEGQGIYSANRGGAKS